MKGTERDDNGWARRKSASVKTPFSPEPSQYQIWGTSLAAQEIARNYPICRKLGTRASRHFMSAMDLVSTQNQSVTWNALRKRFHLRRRIPIEEVMTADELGFLASFDRKYNAVKPFQHDLKDGLLSAKQLAGIVISSIADELGATPKKSVGGLWEVATVYSRFDFKTHFDFGARGYQLSYWHDVLTKEGLVVKAHMSINDWFGISSQTCWDDIGTGQVEELCSALRDAIKIAVQAVNDPVQ
jgi:hypothetical protein